MKVGLIGSVESSLITLQKLVQHSFEIVGVWGYEPNSIKNVSGYCNLSDYSKDNNIDYYSFESINSEYIKEQIRNESPDILFVVGISQLVNQDIIDVPKYGCVGFHPTKLPKGRGRAPLAWLVLNETHGAATFFKIEKGTDDGPIYVQREFEIEDTDDVTDVAEKIHYAMQLALDEWLPKLKSNNFEKSIQNSDFASYYAKRAPLDGCIDWYDNSKNIDKLIKATTNPHPGAYSFYGNYKVKIWKSETVEIGYPTGVIGRVVALTDNLFPVIQCSVGYIIIKEYDFVDYEDKVIDRNLIIGSRLGYYEHNEIFKLRNELDLIKEKIKILENGQ